MFVLLFNSRLLGVDIVEDLGIELEPALVGEKAVLLLLYVVKLGVAEGEAIGILKKGLGQRLIAGDEFLLGLGRVAVAPAAFLIAPFDAAVFRYEIGLTLVALSVTEGDEDAALQLLGKGDGILIVFVDIEDIGVNVEVAAGIDNGTGVVSRLGHIVDQLQDAVVLSVTVVVPRFVEGTPTDEGGMRVIALYRFHPFGQEVPYLLEFVDADAPVTVLAPYEIAQLICPVEETGLEDLLMESCTVEAELHGVDDIVLQRLVGGGGVDAVGIEALIEDPSAEDTLAVQEELALGEGYLAKTEVGVDGIKNLAILFHGEGKVVESARADLPKITLGKGDRKGSGHAVDGGGGFAHRLALVGSLGGNGDAYGIFRKLQGEGGGGVRDGSLDLDVFDMGRIDGFQPYGLPDAGGSGVGAAGGVVALALLTYGLIARADVVVGGEGDIVAAILQLIGDIEGEGSIATLMAAHVFAVDPYGGDIIHSAEVEDDPLA